MVVSNINHFSSCETYVATPPFARRQLQGNRHVSWHESAALNVGMRLWRCTRKAADVSLGGARAIYFDDKTCEPKLSRTKSIDLYFADKHPQSERDETSFWQFECQKMTKRRTSVYPNVLSYYLQPTSWPPKPAYLETMMTLHMTGLRNARDLKNTIEKNAWLAQSCVRDIKPVLDKLSECATLEELPESWESMVQGVDAVLSREMRATLEAEMRQLKTISEQKISFAQKRESLGLNVDVIDAARLRLFEEKLPSFPPHVRAAVKAIQKRMLRNKRKASDEDEAAHVDDEDRGKPGESDDDEDSEAHMLNCIAPRKGMKLVADDTGQPRFALDDMADTHSWHVLRQPLTDPKDGHEYSVDELEKWLTQTYQQHGSGDATRSSAEKRGLKLPKLDAAKIAELNDKQRCALAFLLRDMRKRCDAIMNDSPMPRQLRMILYGAGGVGKSEVTLWAVTLMRLACDCNDVVETQAAGGSAAFLVGGATIHSRHKIVPGIIEQAPLVGEPAIRLKGLNEGKWYDFTDEFGTCDPILLAQEEKRTRDNAQNSELWGDQFGKIISGDLGQLSFSGQLHRAPTRKSGGVKSQLASERGRHLYRQFDSAAFLEQNMRTGPGQEDYAELLARHRVGMSTDEDLRKIVDMQLWKRSAEDVAKFARDDTLFCYPKHEWDSELEPGVRHHNKRKLAELNSSGVPCGICVARDDVQRGCRPTPSKARGLLRKLWLARGARVACTMNLAQSFGVVNGANGTVWDVIYDEGVRPIDAQTLPRVVLVEMDKCGAAYPFSSFASFTTLQHSLSLSLLKVERTAALRRGREPRPLRADQGLRPVQPQALLSHTTRARAGMGVDNPSLARPQRRRDEAKQACVRESR